MGFRFSTVETASADQDSLEHVLVWVWLIGGSAVVLIGVLWILRQNREESPVQTGPVGPPQPVDPPAPAITSAPVAESASPETTSEMEVTSEPTPPPELDDLKKIKGIGPKISQALKEEGIYTFEQLAEIDVEVLHNLMVERGWQMASPDTWPVQARQLAEAKRNKKQGR